MRKILRTIHGFRQERLKNLRPRARREFKLIVKLRTLEQELIRNQTATKRHAGINSNDNSMMDNITDAVYGLDTQWRINYINKVAGIMKGGDYKQYLGKNIWEVFPTLVGTMVEEQYYKAMGEQVAVHFETPSNVFPDVIFEIHAYPTPEGLIVYYRDITEQKRLQQQFYEMKKMEAIGQFAGGVAHDLNNQLVIIASLIDLRFQKEIVTKQVYQDFLQIRNAAEKAADLTRQILMFSQNYPQNYKLLNLNDTITRQQMTIQTLTGADIMIQYHLADNLWFINADIANMEQVLENLIVNAREAMPRGGPLEIGTTNILMDDSGCRDCEEAVPGRVVRLTVADQGVGMDETTLTKIFEPFFTTKDFSSHKGLGLSVIYGIVKSHKGWIRATSKVNEGSRFELFFPAES